MKVRSGGQAPVDIEAVRIEEACAEEVTPCPCGEEESFCLDRGFDRERGPSSLLPEVRGHAGHAHEGEDYCGKDGYYYVIGRDSVHLEDLSLSRWRDR